jgi:hypothetical protein
MLALAANSSQADVLENTAMKAMRGFLIVAGLIVPAGGCGSGFISNIQSGVSVSRNNGEVTVTIGGDEVAVGSGNVAEAKRPVEAFHGVAVEHVIEATFEEGNSGELTVEADDNLLPLVETKIEDGVLRVRIIGSLRTRNPIRVTGSVSQLSEVSAVSSASVMAPRLSGDAIRVHADSSGRVTTDEIRGERIELSASSSGHVAARNVDGKRLHVRVDSSGRVTAAGEVDQQEVEASSSGAYEGEELASRAARVAASSSGSAAVQVKEELSGSASSAGQVRYFGDPAEVSVQESSAGSVTKG